MLLCECDRRRGQFADVVLAFVFLMAGFLCLPGLCRAQGTAVKTGANAKTVDLLKRIDLKRDLVSGDALLENGKLIFRSTVDSRVTVVYEPPRNYDVQLDVLRTEKNGTLVFILILDGKQVAVMLDSFWMKVSGLTYVDGLDLDAVGNDSAYRHPVLPLGEKMQVRCQIRGPRLKIDVGDKTILNWKGKNSRTSVPGNWATPNTKALMIGCHTPFEVSRMELTEVDADELAVDAKIEGALEVTKALLPKESSVIEGRKTIRELFRKEYDKAKNASGKAALAETLLSRVSELQEDPTGLYCMLAEAAENAASAGDLPLALKAIEAVDDSFQTPAFSLKEKVAKIYTPMAKTPDQILFLIEVQQAVIREALAADEIETAERSGQAATGLSRKLGIATVKEQLFTTMRSVAAYKLALQSAAPAQQTLKEKPDDPAANLTWGKHVCFVKGDWLTGLPLLAKSEDAKFAALAKRDLEQPIEAAENIQLADDWWAVGDEEKEPAKTNIWLHAVESYNRALPSLTGLNLSSTERKIARLFGGAPILTAVEESSGVALADPSLNLGLNATVEMWVQTRAASGTLLSKRLLEPEGTLGLQLSNGKACLFEHASYHSREAPSQFVLNDGNWHHFAIVKASPKAAMFIDGQLQANIAVREQLKSNSPWTLGMSIGQRSVAVKACKFRVSNIPRYVISFKPDYTYKKDKATVFISDAK